MINDVSVFVPSAEFKQVLNTYAAGSKRRFQDSIYSRLRDVIIRAYLKTKVAAKHLIEHKLGAVGYKTSISRKTGKFTKRKLLLQVGVQETLAERIVQTRYRQMHGFGQFLPRDVAREKARKLIAAILRTVGFIRSGWIPALRKLNSKLKDGHSGSDFQSSEQRGAPKGYLTEAKSLETLMLEAGNTTKVAGPIGGQALAEAFAEVQANMERKIAEAMKPELDKIDGKVIR
jgi:hypothetical protein